MPLRPSSPAVMADEQLMMALVQELQKEIQQQEHTIEVQRETIGVLKKRLLEGGAMRERV